MKKLLFLVITIALVSCGGKDDDDNTAPAPVAKFAIQSYDNIAPEEISFTNQSENATDFVWFFGDGQASMDKNPTHQYKKGGDFVVYLKVFGPGGKDSVMKNITLEQPATTYEIINTIPVTLDNVRSFYLDWEAMQVYDIIDHGSMSANEISEIIPTSNPTVEVLFFVEGTYYHMAFPDPIIANELNTITIYDTSSCWVYEEDPISSSSMNTENNRKLIKIEELVK